MISPKFRKNSWRFTNPTKTVKFALLPHVNSKQGITFPVNNDCMYPTHYHESFTNDSVDNLQTLNYQNLHVCLHTIILACIS